MREFQYVRADNADNAVRAMQNAAPSQYLAGGTTLLDLMKLDVARPAQIVDINDLRARYGHIEIGAGKLRLGAFVRMADIADHPAIRHDVPVIAQSLQLAASQQIRNMATLGGNVLQRTRCSYFRDTSWGACNKRIPGSGCAALDGVNRKHAVLGTSSNCIAAYAGDFAQALIALDAQVELVTARGAQMLPFANLHLTPGSTPHIEVSLHPGDLITGFTIPTAPWMRRSLYLKIRDRQSYEFALASAAVALHLENNIASDVRIALGGVATKPWRARQAEDALRGRFIDENSAANAAQAAFAEAAAHGQNGFKLDLGRRTLTRALLQAARMEV